jgi:hypothetical protein
VFWTRGASKGTVLVATDAASTLVLTVHVGPHGGRVQLLVDDRDRSLDLAHDDTRTIEIGLSGTRHLVPVTVSTAQPFQPRDHEPGSTDARWLGAQVRVGLR